MTGLSPWARLEDESVTRAAGTKVGAAERMTTVREAFRHRRLARQQRWLWLFYLEHNLFENARESRRSMMEHLRCASRQWRLNVFGPSSGDR